MRNIRWRAPSRRRTQQRPRGLFLHHKAGHEIPVFIRAVPIHNERGSIIGAVETFENLRPAPSANDRGATRQMPDSIDSMTGVASRDRMLSQLRETMIRFTRDDDPIHQGAGSVAARGRAHWNSTGG